MRKNKILVPIDGSEFSRQILTEIPRFLDASTNQLILYEVAEEPRPVHLHDSGVDIDIYVDQIEDGLQMQMAEELRDDMAMLRKAGFEVQALLSFGDRPAKSIESLVQESEIDMIAMTTHGRTGLHRVFAGSVAEHVLHHINVPILLLRPTEAVVQGVHQHNGKVAEPMPLV